MSTLCVQRSSRALNFSTLPIPLFLAPAFANPTSCSFSVSTFKFFSSTPSCSVQKIRNREKNKKRGVSAIRRTGPKQPLSISKFPLPRPVLDSARRDNANPDHGLWGFFAEDQRAIHTPEEESSHGRSWTYKELSRRDFNDLHQLYWVCTRERNQIATRRNEMDRLRVGYGAFDSEKRMATVSRTMKLIRYVLRHRQESWEDARTLLETKGSLEYLKELRSDVMEEEESYEDMREAVDARRQPSQLER